MSKPTLSLYGSKDIDSRSYPVFTHAHNLCLMQDGEIIKYIELERYTRRKYDNRLDLFIDEMIESKAIDLPSDFDFVLVNDFLSNSFISKSGRFRFECGGAQSLKPSLIDGTLTLLREDCSVEKKNAFCLPHELAHTFSCLPFYGDLKDNSLLFSLDGASSLGNYSAFLYRDGRLHLIENNWTDLGYVSKFFNDNSLTFRMLNALREMHCSVPGKLMGFASLGVYKPEIENWLRENQFFKDCWGKEQIILQSAQRRFDVVASFDTHDKFMQDCAATLQHVFENAVLRKLEQLQDKCHCDNLYYGGGCALNIVTNTKIVESGMFREVFIAPCCNDSGLSIGAAAFVERQKGNEIKTHSPYLNNVLLPVPADVRIDNITIQKAADILLRGGIIGVCNGCGEAGPRALGNRSLLALANSKELAQRLSMAVKKREWYRPVAPVMLLRNAVKVSEQKVTHLAKFMLQDFTIKSEYRNQMEGVVHANNTARIQTIACLEENPFVFTLLSYLYEKHGIIALINTSFNAAGEPIVHTKDDALRSAKRMGLDALVYNNQLIENENI